MKDDHATQQLIRSYQRKLPLKFLVETKPGKNNALNRAIPEAKGELLVFTDDDVTPDKQWLQEIIKAIKRWPDVRVFGGRVEPIFPSQVSAKIANASFAGYVFAKYHPYDNEQISVGTFPVGPNCWFRRSIFDEGFRYDPTIGPDGASSANRTRSGSELEFFVRLTNAGEKIVYVPTAIVFHRIQKHQLTYTYLLKRAYAGGRGWIRIYNPGRDAITWFGVPRFLFRNLLVEAAFTCIFLVMGKNFLEPAMKVFQYLGAIQECRYTYNNKRN